MRPSIWMPRRAFLRQALRHLIIPASMPLIGMAAQAGAQDRAERDFAPVTPGRMLRFPDDFGAHPDYRTEWWYATGWLEAPGRQPLGFQITFFRSSTAHDRNNPSAFAPRQLIIGHAALSFPEQGRLLHAEKTAREGFGLAGADTGNTNVWVNDWRFRRDGNGKYHATITAREFTVRLELAPTQPVMLQGDRGFSRKGPGAQHASYYYSEPHLRVQGTVSLSASGRPLAVQGSAWLDHEWSNRVLEEQATGWDWTGINLDDGSALMAFRIRDREGNALWAHAALRDKSGRVTQFAADAIDFTPLRFWQSPRTGARYPVAVRIATGDTIWELAPLLDDQELDSRRSTGAVYWEGAVRVSRNGRPAGRGYLELTGYVKPLKL